MYSLSEGLHSTVAKFWMEGNVTRSLPLCMTSDASLGRCPDCGERISRAWLLVEYEKDNGTTGIWAECPSCEDVVSPE